MSLYNAIFGQNPFAGILLQALGITQSDVPRYRDCWVEGDGDAMEIIVYTRTGGGNRDYYDCEDRRRANYPEDCGDSVTGPWNSDLRALPGFKYDEDDDFDCTYARFRYSVPAPFKVQFELLKKLGGERDPKAAWEAVLDGLRGGGTSDPTVARALAVGESILGQIVAATGQTGAQP